MSASVLPPLSLYVHFPWCLRKCPYCDFNSHALHGELPERAYVEALLMDLDTQIAGAAGRPLQSIFLGGGTPSLFPARALARLLEGVRARMAVAADAEVTLEANPGAIEHGAFAGYRDAGITRVSLGAQSFDAGQLSRLGRIHGPEEIDRAAAELQAAGLTNFNLDLMYALPQQSTAQALADLERAIALQPAHLSHYQLTLESGTVFAGRPPAGLPDADIAAEMQQLCQQRLDAAGYRQYEVSAYARVGARCRHNLNYWEFGDYLGIGAGAHAKRTRCGPVVERAARVREPRRYLSAFASSASPNAPRTPAAALAADFERVPPAQLPFEYLLNALRLVEGFEQTAFEARTGLPFAALRPGLARAQALGLLDSAGSRWRPSARGLNFLNDLLSLFLPSARNGAAVGG